MPISNDQSEKKDSQSSFTPQDTEAAPNINQNPVEQGKRDEPEKVLISWQAPERPFKRRNREFYTTIYAMAGIAGLVLFLIDGWAPVVLIISLVFLFYVMSTIEPFNVTNSITNKGLSLFNHKLVEWGDLGRFWFSRRFDNELLILETNFFPGRMELVIDPKLKKDISSILNKYLKEEEIPPSSLDRAANWFTKKLPQS